MRTKKTLLLTFNFVQDNAGHTTLRSSTAAPRRITEINRIYNGQANIYVTLLRTRLVIFDGDLGHTVTTKKAADDATWNSIIDLGDSTADVNFFIVWRYELVGGESVADTDAATAGGDCISEDRLGMSTGRTMAHELGHSMGEDDMHDIRQDRQLMYAYTSARGDLISKEVVNRINP